MLLVFQSFFLNLAPHACRDAFQAIDKDPNKLDVEPDPILLVTEHVGMVTHRLQHQDSGEDVHEPD